MEQNILYSMTMGKVGTSNFYQMVALLSKSLEPVVDMHNDGGVICSCVVMGNIVRLMTRRCDVAIE